MSIRRLVQLVVDRNAAKRAEAETKRALERGTDPKKPTENLRKVGSSLERLRGIAVKVGSAMAGIWAVKRVFDFGAAVFRVGANVRAVGSQFRTVFGGSASSMNAWLEDFRRVAGLTRREAQGLSAGVGSMGQGFGMSEEAAASFAKQVLELSGDLASFNDVPTAEAAQLVQSAIIGNTEAARSLKVSFTALDVQQRALAMTGKRTADELTQEEKALAALAVMTERAGPQIGDLNRTQYDADVQAKQLAGSWTNLKETLAAAMVGGTAGSTVFADLRDVFEDLTRWVEANSAEIGHWSSVAIDVARAVGGTIVGIFNLIGSVAGSISSHIVLTVRFWQEAFARGADGVSRIINGIIEGLNHLPGVDIDFRVAGVDVEHFEAMRKAAAEDLKSELGGVADALVQIGDGWVQVGKKALSAERAQRQAVGVDEGGAPVVPATSGAVELTEEEREANARFLRQLDAQARATEAVRQFRQDELEKLRAQAMSVADGMTDAFTQFFEATATGFGGQGDVFSAAADAARGAGAAIVEALVAGRAETEMALGTAALASGLWPPNPAALAAASKHFLAAGLFRAIPGIIRGSGGGGGGGGGAASLARGAIATSAPSVQDPVGSEVHVYIDPLAPGDERFQRVVLGATQNAQERFGDNVRVHIHPRSAGNL